MPYFMQTPCQTKWHQGSNVKPPLKYVNPWRVCPTPLLKVTWGNSNLRGEICFAYKLWDLLCKRARHAFVHLTWELREAGCQIALNCQEACWTLVYTWGSARFVSWDICGPTHDHANPQNPSTWWHQKPHWYRQRLNAYCHQHWWCRSLLTNLNKPAKLCALVSSQCNTFLQLEKTT